MSDLISRQAAIDALGEEPPVWCDTDGEIAEREQWRCDVAAIMAVPSVEPTTGELVRCKDCDWWEKSDNSLQGRCARYGFYPTGEYYCAGAELKRDHEYERATDQLNHDILYEPTFNPDDGSM